MAPTSRGALSRDQGGQPKGLMRFIDWIWHVRGALPIPEGQSRNETFECLSPLFQESGTTHAVEQDSLRFHKKDPAAQDRMSVFDEGTLRIEQGNGGPVLRYDLTSRALLFCFLAPLLFLAFAQATIAINAWQSPAKETAVTKGAHAAKKPKAKEAPLPMNPIDKALGAPAPDKPEGGDADEEGPKKPSPTPAYVFAGIFVALYIAGRILEDWLVRSLFRRILQGT